MWSEMSGHGWGWMVFGGLHMLAFWIVIILAIAALVKWLSSGSGRARTTALESLSERYARGEINREDYLRMKTDLDQ